MMPPMTTVASGRYTSAPVPVLSAIGVHRRRTQPRHVRGLDRTGLWLGEAVADGVVFP